MSTSKVHVIYNEQQSVLYPEAQGIDFVLSTKLCIYIYTAIAATVLIQVCTPASHHRTPVIQYQLDLIRIALVYQGCTLINSQHLEIWL